MSHDTFPSQTSPEGAIRAHIELFGINEIKGSRPLYDFGGGVTWEAIASALDSDGKEMVVLRAYDGQEQVVRVDHLEANNTQRRKNMIADAAIARAVYKNPVSSDSPGQWGVVDRGVIVEAMPPDVN